MGAKKSPEMKEAERLVKLGYTPYSAAKRVGLTPSAIYMSRWYKEFNKQTPSGEIDVSDS